jgi:dual specificity tyrosine-phosphorylation-regulated kinase 2/3/4
MNSNSSSDLENEVFLPATKKTAFLSSGIRFLRRRKKSKNINDSKAMKELLTSIPEPKLEPVTKPSLYADIVKNKEELKQVIEGPIVAPGIKPAVSTIKESYIEKSKSYPEESKKPITHNSSSTNSDEIFTMEPLSPLPNLRGSNILKSYYNLKYFSHLVEDDSNINRDLKDFEVNELYEFKDHKGKMPFDKIYYLAPTANFNYLSGVSDENGNYIFYTYDHILYRYKPIDIIGKGSYGTVLKCVDYKYKIDCALKIVKSKKQYKNCMQKEINILYRLSEEYIKYKNKGIDTHFFTQYLKSFEWRGHGIIAFKLYSKDLYHARLGKVKLPALKVIMRDLFGALIFLKQSNVIHCDLKPENIMFINEQTYNVVLGDFGLAKINDLNKPQTDFNVQTCWYRSPEVAMHIPYSYESDLWSIGVILMELMIDYPIFRAKTDVDLFYLYLKLLGDNPSSMIQVNPELRNFTVMGNKRIGLDRHLEKITAELRTITNKAVEELINGIIVWDPKNRLTLRKCFELANNI